MTGDPDKPPPQAADSDGGPRRSASAQPLAALRAVLGEGAPARESIGVVAAQPGIGKTAVLVQIALDALLNGRRVLHVSLHDTVEHTRAHYDEIVRALGETVSSAAAAGPKAWGAPSVLVRVERSRMILSFHHKPFAVPLVQRNLEVFADAAHFVPDMLIVDGFASGEAVSEHLAGLRALAASYELWVSVTTEGDLPVEPSDRVLRLVSAGRAVKLIAADGQGALQVDLLTGLATGQDPAATPRGAEGVGAKVNARDCMLYSGGAAGAEAAFGESAERHGVNEMNLTFDGHLQARTRGRHELTAAELAMGDVSLSYVSRRLNRTYNDQGGLIRGVLQTLWHMVSRSQQVFVVGRIQEDGTVVGGTGWSVELARMWSRDLWVFDQDKLGWYRWEGTEWSLATPRITATHICGTGTRYLEESGRRAIEELFARSFG